MSKTGKRGKISSTERGGVRWEPALLATNLEEDDWKPNISLIVGNKVDDYKNIDILISTVNSGVRRLFSVITKENLYNEAKELGNPKTKKGKDVPNYYEVCEPCKVYIDAGEEIPLLLQAKLIKFRLLTIRTADIKRRELEKKAQLEKEKAKKDKTAGKDSRAKSPGKKGGKKTPDLHTPREGSKLKKRGEENNKSKMIDDEPDDGAQHYILIFGFNNPHLMHFLGEVGVNIDCIIRISSQDYSHFIPPPPDPNAPEKDEKAQAAEAAAKEVRRKLAEELRTFRHDMLYLLRNNPDSSNLHDIARLDYEVKSLLLPASYDDAEQKNQFGLAMFEDVACMIYDLQDARRLYYTYLKHLKLINVASCGEGLLDKTYGESHHFAPGTTPAWPIASGVSGSAVFDRSSSLAFGNADMRYYNDLMNSVPQESVSVALIIHCMVEQVVAIEESCEPPSEQVPAAREDGLSWRVADYLRKGACKLALSEEEHKVLSEALNVPHCPSEEPKPPLLINVHDDISIRTHHLKSFHDFSPLEVERAMLKLHPLAQYCCSSRPSSATIIARNARLQELIHFCSNNGLSPSEIDRAFKQFVFESMDFAATDPNGFLLTRESEGLGLSSIPWDDPYPFFKVMIPKEHKAQAEFGETPPVEHSDNELEFSRRSTPSPCSGTDHAVCRSPQPDDRSVGLSQAVYTGSKDKEIHPSQRVGRSVSRGAKQQGKKTDDKRPSVDNGKKGILRSRSGSFSFKRSKTPDSIGSDSEHVIFSLKPSSVHFDIPPDAPVDSGDADISGMLEQDGKKTVHDHMLEVVEAQKRVLDHWCFAEHYEHQVLIQVLKEAAYVLPFVETYNSKRDQSVMLVLHNPFNLELQNHVDWHTELHSNVGFRNYLEHIAESIGDWLKEKEAEYQAQLLSAEVEKMRLEEEDEAKATEKKGRKSKAKIETRSKSPKPDGSRSSSTESIAATKIYIRPNSLKAWKQDQERIAQAEALLKEIGKDLAKKDKKDSDDEEKEDKKSGGSKTKTPTKDELGGEDQLSLGKEKESYWPFTGYNTGNLLIHVSGLTSTLFPSDGGQIRSERTEFVQGTVSVNASVLKDGHVFVVHVLNPRELEMSVDLDWEPQATLGAYEEELEKTAKGDEETGKKAAPVSQFGSVTATLVDGMALSFSQWGVTGETEEGKPYEPPPYIPPESSPTPSQQTQQHPKGKKEKSNKTIATSEPLPAQDDDGTEEEKEKEEKIITEQSFQEVFITCPDGLQVRYFLQSCVGVVPTSAEDRHLVVKQSYPFRTNGMQDCEASRKRYVMSEISRIITADGTVVKNMVDGSVEVLFADGMVGVHKGHWHRRTNHTDVYHQHSPCSQPDPVETPTKKGRSSGKSIGGRGQPEKVDDPLQEIHEILTEEQKYRTWTITYPDGKRCQINSDGNSEHLKPVLVCGATDPDTKQTMATRDDKVITVSYPDGMTVVEHSDGTRITVYYRDMEVHVGNQATETGEPENVMPQTLKFVKIECPAYATVEFNCATSENLTVFGSGTSLNVFPDGYYIMHHVRGGRIEIDTEGTMVYFPRPNKTMEQLLPVREQQYILRHNADVICETVDPEGNIFSVKSTGDFFVMPINGGDATSESSEEHPPVDKKLTHYKQHAPRFFIVHADGSGTELLRYQDIAEYLIFAERNPAIALLKEPLPDYPGVKGMTVLKPYIGGVSERWLKKYDQPSIVPSGIRSRDLTSLPAYEFKKPGPCFGTNVGQGLNVGAAVKTPARIAILKCPSELELRQFVQYKPMSEELRKRLQQSLREYAEFALGRSEMEDLMAVQDPRSQDEKDAAADLFSSSMSQRPEPIEAEFIKQIYEKAVAPPPPSPPPTPQPKRTHADWERDLRELTEEVEGKAMLRGKRIPSYFKSEIGKAFLLTQAKDMEELLQELSEDPRQDGSKAVCADFTYLRGSFTQKFSAFPKPKEAHSEPEILQEASRSDTRSDSALFMGKTKHPLDTQTSFPFESIKSELDSSSFCEIPPISSKPADSASKGSQELIRPNNPTPSKASNVLVDRPVSPTPKIAGNYADSSTAFGNFPWGEYPMILEQPLEEDKAEKDGLAVRSLKVDVAGDPRSNPVPLPKAIKGGRPNAKPNVRYIEIEEPVRRHVRNTVAHGATKKGAERLHQMRGLDVFPEQVNFGVLREGSTYVVLVQLKNTGLDSCHFKVRQPPPATGLRIIYKPGAVAAGMKADLRLELYAIAVGVEGESGVGAIQHDLEIVTETDILQIPVQATVLTAHEYDAQCKDNPASVGHTAGTVLVSTKPPASTGIIRPRKELIAGVQAR